MASIPASQLVSIQPGVISPGGSPLTLNSVFLTESTAIPLGQVLSFPTQAAVASYFGPLSTEASLATKYFGGYSTMKQVPGAMLFSQFNYTAIAGWMRGGTTTLTLAQIKAMIPAVATGSSISGATLTVGTVTGGVYVPGMLLTGSSVTSGTRIIQQLPGGTPGGAGTYQVSAIQTVVSTTITGAYDLTVTIDGGSPITAASLNLAAATSLSSAATLIGSALGLSGGQTITYSSQFGAFTITSGTSSALSSVTVGTGLAATVLSLTTATGAALSPGSAGMSEGAALTAITNITQNWAAFMTCWEPNLASKLLFAAWVNSQDERYAYVCYDSDITITQSIQSTPTSFGPLTADYDGVIPVYLDPNVAAFICGTIAAIDFFATNGRITLAYKSQSGLAATVTDPTVAANLIANGYNFYGSYATANQQFTFLQPGQISGQWNWIDAYVNQISMNAAFQLAGMTFLSQINSLPYNDAGYTSLKNIWSGTIQQYKDFGAIVSGVTLSSTQVQEVNTAAGLAIDQAIYSNGYYLQVLDANPTVRGQRGSPPCNFWYADGGSIHKLNLASIDLE